MKKIFLTLSFALFATAASACSSLLVGKRASADGSAFITYSADSYGMFGRLRHYPAMNHPKGTVRRIIDGDTNRPLGEIPEVSHTYAVMAHINEHQVAITETTFGGRHELVDTAGVIDYVSLMTIALQRSKTAREAIKVMTSLVQEHGYASEGESFSIADPNEVWILEMIGKGSGNKGAVWVAQRIPDDCIAAHANHSRIRRFNMRDKENVMYAPDVVKFARSKGYFEGKDADFDFSAAYAPAEFSAIRFCETRVWSLFNRFVNGMDEYLDYADGRHINEAAPMPLYFKPARPVSLADVMNAMRDHYENTPFNLANDPGAGIYGAPYRPTPLVWEHNGKKYFNERPVSTQQASFTVVAQMRGSLPAAIGGVLWVTNDDANMAPYTPIYCSVTKGPECYDPKDADAVTFSWESAFWVQNWVANMTYPRYSQLFPTLEAYRNEIERKNLSLQESTERHALEIFKDNPAKASAFLTDYSLDAAKQMMTRWRELGQHLIVKYNDQAVKPEDAQGRFLRSPHGLGATPERPGFDAKFRETIVKETGNKFLMEE